MAQKVLRIGASAGVTLPKKVMEELGIKRGDEVTIDVDKKSGVAFIKPAVKVDKELLDWTDKFVKKYRPALEALANK